MTVTFTLTYREFAAAVRGRSLRDPRRWFSTAALFPVLVLVVVVLTPSWAMTVTVSALYVLIALIGAFVYDPIRTWRREAPFRYEQTLAVTEAGVHYHKHGESSQTSWDDGWKTLHTLPSAYVLVHSTGWVIVPRRAFISRDAELAFIGLVRRHIGMPDRT